MRGKAILVGAAPFQQAELRAHLRRALQESGVLRVAVDGGLELFKSLKITPDLYVGDLDSVRRIPSKIPSVFLPHRKDYSDLRAALEICAQMRISRVEAFAVTGGRADHHWASIQELSEYRMGGAAQSQLEAHGEDGSFFWVTPQSPLKISSRRGESISIFNLDHASGVTTRGLAYNLSSGRLHSGSHGLSNQVRARSVSVSVKRGVVLVILPRLARTRG